MNRFAKFTTRKFFLFLFIFLLNSQFSILNSELNTTETKLATIPEDYQQVSKIVFSPDGREVAYKAQKGDKEFVVVGNKAGKSYERVAMESLLLSPDGQRVAYDMRRREKEYLVLDGKEGKPYDIVSPTTFSPDGSVVVCQVEERRKWFVMVTDGDKETFHSPHYDMSHIPPVFSPDSRLIFYVLGDGEEGKQTIFATDVHTLEVKKARIYAWIRNVTLSVNGLRFAYPAKKEKEGKVFVVLSDLALPARPGNEEKEGPPYDWIWIGSIAISPNGQRLAYMAGKEGKTFLVISNWDSPSEVKENGPYDEVGQSVFSPDGSLLVYPARKEGKWFVVSGASDGSLPHHEGKSYDWVEPAVFSPDGTLVTYPASKDGKWFVVSGASDGSLVQEGPAYDMVVTPIFSPDGKYLIYRARRGERERFIVIADPATGSVLKEGPVCDEVWQPVFSADGKFACYGARIGRELWWKVATTD